MFSVFRLKIDPATVRQRRGWAGEMSFATL
jgi:hypothetical protein